MKRVILVLFAVAVVVFVAYRSYVALASDKTHIIWLLEDAASSFNDTKLSGCLEAFDKDYRDETLPGVDLSKLRMALQFVFFRRVDQKTRAFLMRVRLPEEERTIQVEGDGKQATAEFTLALEQRRDGAWTPQWELRVSAQMRKVDGQWSILRASHQTVQGERPK